VVYVRAAIALCAASLAFAAPAAARSTLHTAAHKTAASVAHARTFDSPHAVTHLAVHWRGQPNARVSVAMSRDGRHFGRRQTVVLDDDTAPKGPETYGTVMLAYGVRAVRVYTDRALSRLTVLWLTDRGRPARATVHAAAAVAQPTVTPRVDWGADESLRYDSTGKEIWPPAFYPVQKLIVHHTATQNNDPDPAATVRSIYYYHAVTQGWGDIGYNFLIDEQGRIYEGRHTFDYPSGSSPTEENSLGYGVTAAHAQGFNSGTVGIALLGTLTNQDATPAARNALEQLLGWEASHHGIDPQGSSLYTNPVSGTQATFPNIAGHRDVAATECPGGTFYATLPSIRSDVAAMLAGSPPPPAPDFSLTASPTSRTVVRGQSTTYSVAISPSGGFADPVSLAASGLPAGASASFSPNPATSSSTMSVTTARTTQQGSYTVRITGTSGSLTHTASVTLQVKRK
jgi:hypothetical protein